MTLRFRFGAMLKKHEVAYELIQSDTGSYNADGVWEEDGITHNSLRGNIQPFSQSLKQSEGGSYTEDDRVLYTTNKHVSGEIIEYKGIQYTTVAPDPREYSDVNKYILEARAVNGPIQGDPVGDNSRIGDLHEPESD